MVLLTLPNGGSVGDERMLDSWKEIASYLGRSVRTVQTWEKNEGLPVHRHQHRKGGTVYAYASELDAWRVGRDELARGRPGVRETLLRRPWLAAVVVASLAIVAFVAVQLPGARTSSTSAGSHLPLGFEEQDWLLIAAFDNQTGEELLDGVLEDALRRELVDSEFLNVASPERVGDTLRLMRRPADSPVDENLAWEVAQRDGAIRAVLIGRVQRVASSLLVGAELLSPAEDRVLASFSEVADGPEDVLTAVAGLARRVRESLGETLPTSDASPDGLERVSTPSLQALRLYTHADRLLREGVGPPERRAEQLLREALAEDPEFASAHILMAWTRQRVRDPGVPASDYLTHAEKAAELADRSTVVERDFIHGSLHHLRYLSAPNDSDAEAALARYRSLLFLDPGHYWARNNFWYLLGASGRGQEALTLAQRSLEARPNDLASMARLAYQLVVDQGDLEQARPFVERARQLRQQLELTAPPFLEAFLELYSAHELWVQGEMGEAVRAVDDLVEAREARAAQETGSFLTLARQAITFYNNFGIWDRADEIQAEHGAYSPAVWANLEAWRRYDTESGLEMVRRRRDRRDAHGLAWDASLLASWGYLAEAESYLQALPEDVPDGAKADALDAQGRLAFAARRHDQAISDFEASLALRQNYRPHPKYMRTAISLAKARVAGGEPGRGLQLLEETSRQLKPRLLGIAPNHWLRTRLNLAQLQRELGHESEAREIERELRRYCAWADPEFWILRELGDQT